MAHYLSYREPKSLPAWILEQLREETIFYFDKMHDLRRHKTTGSLV